MSCSRLVSVSSALIVFCLTVAAAPANAQDRRVVIVNKSSQSITQLFASNSGQTKWGGQILDYVIPPGRTQAINFDDGTGSCMFDFKAVTRRGNKIEKYRSNVCVLETWTITD